MAEQNAHAHYLRDLADLLTDEAQRASREAKANPNEWNKAYLMAFVQVLDLMRQQTTAFDLPLAALGRLAELDPERDLLTLRPD